MKDEIKEILDKLKDGNWYDELDLTGTMWIELRWEETHLLLDYITNLQKENKKLSKEIKNIEKKDDEIRVKNSFLVNGFHELEIRIDKAIEYIKTHKNDYEPYVLSDYNIRELLNILQGENDDRRNME